MAAITLTGSSEGVDIVARVPGSKSVSARALVCAALASGRSRLAGLAPGDDTASMIAALTALGVEIVEETDGLIGVVGTAGSLALRPVTVHAGLAGTTSRFITAVAALGSAPIRIDGENALRRRPMGELHTALTALGAEVGSLGDPGHLPVVITGPIRSGVVGLRGDISSQFLTALVLVAPVIGGLRIDIESELVSRPYLEMTAAVMAVFGADAVEITDRGISVGGGAYRGVDYEVEVDASSASYPLALAAVAGGRATVPGLGRASLQGDRRFADLLGQMGCRVTWTNDSVTVERPVGSRLHGIDVDMSDISDLVPTLAAVAIHAVGRTRITGVGFIRSKESDRIVDLAAELRRFGARITERSDGLEIEGAVGASPAGSEIVIDTHHDHRLAMAAAVAGSNLLGPVTIVDAEVVAKSWPTYWDEFDRWRG